MFFVSPDRNNKKKHFSYAKVSTVQVWKLLKWGNVGNMKNKNAVKNQWVREKLQTTNRALTDFHNENNKNDYSRTQMLQNQCFPILL